jgi:hypothetical protein
MAVSLEDQIKCIARELTMRRNCYPGWVKGGKLKPETAAMELERMEAVLETLKKFQAESGVSSGQG